MEFLVFRIQFKFKFMYARPSGTNGYSPAQMSATNNDSPSQGMEFYFAQTPGNH